MIKSVIIMINPDIEHTIKVAQTHIPRILAQFLLASALAVSLITNVGRPKWTGITRTETAANAKE
ncbi:hypothetical protein JCM39068_41520 [Desulfocastanea catecholica]